MCIRDSLSIARCVKNAIEHVWLPGADAIVDLLAQRAEEFKDMPLLSLTHGQPATPTTLGKELAVYVYRLGRQLKHVREPVSYTHLVDDGEVVVVVLLDATTVSRSPCLNMFAASPENALQNNTPTAAATTITIA